MVRFPVEPDMARTGLSKLVKMSRCRSTCFDPDTRLFHWVSRLTSDHKVSSFNIWIQLFSSSPGFTHIHSLVPKQIAR
jgi:hypothetical protein